jgi:predicted ABC-type ATPase
VPKIILIAGPNGSGKSTLASQIEKDGEFINADKYEKTLLSHILNQEERELKATLIVSKEIVLAISANKSFAFETVFATKTIPSFLKTAKTKGYAIVLHYVATNDTRINIERVAKRVREGGHDVPKQKIVDRYTETLEILPQLVKFADTATLYDNSTDTIKPFLIKENGEIKIIGAVPNWANQVVADLN